MKRRIFAVWAALIVALIVCGCGESEEKNIYARGCEEMRAGDFDAAAATFSEVIAAEKYLPEAYRGKGLCELFLGDYADAAVSLQKSIYYTTNEDEQFQRDVKIYLAYCRERQGKPDEAMEIYNELVMKQPDSEVLFLRGRLYLRNENDREARNDFDQAVSLDPNYQLYINIYELYEDVEKSGDGARYLEEALTEANANENDYYNQGLVEYYLKDYNAAKEKLVQAVRVNENDGRAVFLLGKIYLSSGDLADARAVYRNYISNDQTAARAYNGLALCDLEEKNYESALQNVQSGLEKAEEEDKQGLLFNEIVCYENLHDWNTARAKAAEFITKYPADEAGLAEYEFLSSR